MTRRSIAAPAVGRRNLWWFGLLSVWGCSDAGVESTPVSAAEASCGTCEETHGIASDVTAFMILARSHSKAVDDAVLRVESRLLAGTRSAEVDADTMRALTDAFMKDEWAWVRSTVLKQFANDERVARAFLLNVLSTRGEKRKSGRPYAAHPAGLLHFLLSYADHLSDTEQIYAATLAANGHDILEELAPRILENLEAQNPENDVLWTARVGDALRMRSQKPELLAVVNEARQALNQEVEAFPHLGDDIVLLMEPLWSKDTYRNTIAPLLGLTGDAANYPHWVMVAHGLRTYAGNRPEPLLTELADRLDIFLIDFDSVTRWPPERLVAKLAANFARGFFTAQHIFDAKVAYKTTETGSLAYDIETSDTYPSFVNDSAEPRSAMSMYFETIRYVLECDPRVDAALLIALGVVDLEPIIKRVQAVARGQTPTVELTRDKALLWAAQSMSTEELESLRAAHPEELKAARAELVRLILDWIAIFQSAAHRAETNATLAALLDDYFMQVGFTKTN